MTLLDELLESSIQRGPACSVGLILEDMDDAEEWRAALAHPRVASTKISAKLNTLGHHVKPSSIQRHRRGDCQCPSSTS